MDSKEKLRKQVWVQLRAVAQPDSRFHWDFNKFIPDFENSEVCAETICRTPYYQSAKTVLATPDNSLTSFRLRCLIDQKSLIIPTYGMGRGFMLLEPSDFPKEMSEFAATLDGIERFAHSYPIFESGIQKAPDLMISGASVLNREGVRISSEPNYFDIEWLVLSFLHLVTDQTPIMTIVHNCQIVDMHYDPMPYSLVTDLIVTPTNTYTTGGRYPRPEPSVLRTLPWEVLHEIPILRELGSEEI